MFINSTETDLAYQDVIEGNLLTQVDRTVDLLCTKYARAALSYEGIYRRETPPAPAEALREAVLNAVAHRNYAHSAPVRIRVHDHRIALWSPGSLPLDWTLDKLMGAHASAPHNPVRRQCPLLCGHGGAAMDAGTRWATDRSSSPSTDQRADVEGGPFQRLGTENGIRATEQGDSSSRC
ncbi:MAG: hypothetical protein OXF25_10445 [Cyanobacteria bacterium MAG CAR3_bin_5]|nr:hypothetical protein [Cyanobacteria bacterium MAG CAR3_bin_5]